MTAFVMGGAETSQTRKKPTPAVRAGPQDESE
jgi:hypothetical protein